MYVDTSTVTTKYGTYTRHLLRESYREEGKIKKRLIANISDCKEEEIRAIKLALSYKQKLETLANVEESLRLKQGLSVGAVILLNEISERIGITKALGSGREGKLALWQIFSRIIEQGSRLSAVRLAQSHAVCDVLGLEGFNEDNLYANLKWLSENQEKIEKKLYINRYGENKPKLYLYDVTSSYLEGECNEYGAFGYNRDGKRGKRQIVIGLICDEEGEPLSVEIFKGNMSDCKTVSVQLKKISERYGDAEIVFVGDRGMIRNVSEFKDGVNYITAITKAQIETLLKDDFIQMSLFDGELAEVKDDNGIRYILRKNPIRKEEIAKSKQQKYESLQAKTEKSNRHMLEHPRSDDARILNKLNSCAKKLKISGWIKFELNNRTITLSKNDEDLAEDSKLDGCYVIKTNVSESIATAKTVHSRYKDLPQVEWAFRTSKTSFLELRPIHVRKKESTNGHVFVVMLAYKLVRELSKLWNSVDITTQEAIQRLSALTAIEVTVNGRILFNKIPEARNDVLELINLAGITFPDKINSKNVIVSTRKKLTKNRKRSSQ